MHTSFWQLLFCGLFGISLSVHSAERVISLSPHATEIAYSAGLGNNLIAVSAYSDYPEQAKAIEPVASWQGINIERIIALKPDLVLAWRAGNPQKVIDQLTRLGIPVLYIDPANIAEIAENIRKLAQYSDDPSIGNQNADQLIAEANRLEKRYQRAKPIAVMLQVSINPIITTSAHTIQNDVLRICSAQNVFADSRVPWPQVSREQVLMKKPYAIVMGGSQTEADNLKQFWQQQLDIPVIPLEKDWLYRGSARIIYAAESLCQQLDKYFPFAPTSEFN